MPAVGAADPGKPVHGIAAIQIPGNHLLNDRSERTQLMLELILIGGQKDVPVILEQSVEGAVGKPPRMIGHNRMGGGGMKGGSGTARRRGITDTPTGAFCV